MNETSKQLGKGNIFKAKQEHVPIVRRAFNSRRPRGVFFSCCQEKLKFLVILYEKIIMSLSVLIYNASELPKLGKFSSTSSVAVCTFRGEK